MAIKKVSAKKAKPKILEEEHDAPEDSEEVDLSRAEAAFKRTRGARDALAGAELRSINVDAQRAAVVALTVARRLRQKKTWGLVEAIAEAAPGVVDLAKIEALEDRALAAWFARHKLLLAAATSSKAVVPLALVQEGATIRQRQLQVLEYHLGGDAEAMALLVAIRAGVGHLDLANDLTVLSELYGRYRKELQGDTRNYRAEDAKRGREVAQEILEHLSRTSTSEEKRWRDQQARAYTLLFDSHEEAIRVGRFLSRAPGAELLYPTFVAALRTPPRTKPSSSPPGA